MQLYSCIWYVLVNPCNANVFLHTQYIMLMGGNITRVISFKDTYRLNFMASPMFLRSTCSVVLSTTGSHIILQRDCQLRKLEVTESQHIGQLETKFQCLHPYFRCCPVQRRCCQHNRKSHYSGLGGHHIYFR